MSNYSWPKEDKLHYNNSEVMQELEKRVLETVSRVELLRKKAEGETSAETSAKAQATGELAAETENLASATAKVKAAQSSAHDKESDVSTPNGVTIDVQLDEDSVKDQENPAEDIVLASVVADLREMIKIATGEGNTKLAYRIERTIDEILDIECF